MNEHAFILGAYTITGLLVVGVCVATWLRARRVSHKLTERDRP